ncbi:MAG: L-fucokinase [Spirochaetia bacterium]|jgi:galactokinase/mevalonate kinase-like predicted kinase
MTLFSTCVIVASNPAQAREFRALLDSRIKGGLYPREIEFLVLSDPQTGRVGSGGGTLLALMTVFDRLERGESILMIHAGGESRRMPAYAPEGKLFAPVPAASSSLFPTVILDLQLSLYLAYPWNPGELVVASGDVVIDFDTEALPKDRGDVYGFAKADSFDLGSQHGVFKFNKNRTSVVDFYQKQTADFLERNAALEGSRSCALDLGIIGFSRAGLSAFRRFAESPGSNGGTLLESVKAGRLRFDLYLEVLTACLAGISYEHYRGKIAAQSKLSPDAMCALHEAFQAINLTGFVTKRTRFLHFGSLAEYPESCAQMASSDMMPFYVHEEAEFRPSQTGRVMTMNSREAECRALENAKMILVEGCDRVSLANARGGNLFIGLANRSLEYTIPAGVCLDERHVAGGSVVAVYGVEDTWSPSSSPSKLLYLGIPLTQWLVERGLAEMDLFDGPIFDLYDARLFPVNTGDSFFEGYWNAAAADDRWRTTFSSSKRFTLRELIAVDSAEARETRRRQIRGSSLRQEILGGRGWLSLSENEFAILFAPSDAAALLALYENADDDLLRIYRHKLLGRVHPDALKGDSISALKVSFISGDSLKRHLARGVKHDQIVWARAPVRIDVAGGWTDTPPYTLREGGEVVNVAVNLNDQPPIQVFCRPTDERRIRINSIDLGTRETIETFEGLEDYNNPSSPFALPKAALCLLGLTREGSGLDSLPQALAGIGCGLEISLLSAVPKGSGLGTSSVLAATILAGLQRFFGLPLDMPELFRQVLQIEQMLTTGGGWQDQIGGVAGGVKYIVSRPGIRPDPVIYQLDPFLFQDPSQSALFTLFYTGITRLAKNILQEVVDHVNTMEPAYLFTLRALKMLARRAREAVSLRDGADLALVLKASWEANKRMHESTTNDEVEALLAQVAGLYSGMKLLGAGGGGFAVFMSDTREQADRLRAALARLENDRARMVSMSLNTAGLQVSVS